MDLSDPHHTNLCEGSQKRGILVMTRNNQHKSAILLLLTSIAVLTPICSLVESTPVPTPALVTRDAASANDQADATSFQLAQPQTETPRVSISFSDDLSHTIKLERELPPIDKPGGHPGIDVWYGQFFTAQELRVLSASRVETEPSRLGLKVSFTF